MRQTEWSKEAIDKAFKSFPAFLYIVWKLIGLPPPTQIQIDIAKYLQTRYATRRIIEAFRGEGKSFITCAYAVWRLWRDVNLKVLIVSASGDRADANARFIKKIIKVVPFLSHLLPDKDQLDTQNVFDVAGALPDASPSVKSVGITGQITGTRAGLLISDDVEIPKNSATQKQREKLSEAVKEYDAIIVPDGEILYLGTPQTEDSLYNKLEERGYITRIWPVEVPQLDKLDDYIHDGENRLAPMIQQMMKDKRYGEPTDPNRFTQKEISERRLSYGKAGFQLQFMLNTSLGDMEKYPLRCANLIVTPLDLRESSNKWSWVNSTSNLLSDLPCVGMKGDAYYAPLSRSEKTTPYTGCIMNIDPSGRGKDETAYCILKFLSGYLFLFEVDGMLDGYSDMSITRLAQRARYFGVNEVVIESNFGDGMFTKLLQPIFKKFHPCALTEFKSTGMKEKRIIDTIEPVLALHRLIVNESVITADFQRYQSAPDYSLFYQMTRICDERNALVHDDRLDCLAQGIQFFKSQMDITADDAPPVSDNWLEDAMQIGVIPSNIAKAASQHNGIAIANMEWLRHR